MPLVLGPRTLQVHQVHQVQRLRQLQRLQSYTSEALAKRAKQEVQLRVLWDERQKQAIGPLKQMISQTGSSLDCKHLLRQAEEHLRRAVLFSRAGRLEVRESVGREELEAAVSYLQQVIDHKLIRLVRQDVDVGSEGVEEMDVEPELRDEVQERFDMHKYCGFKSDFKVEEEKE